ncbi:MAG: alanine racemase [Bacteroidota bacterium]
MVSELPTPSVLVERRRLEDNIARMQVRANEAGARLRPHIKTHKSVAIARWQQAAGAQGITVATPSEAVIFADAGFSDIRLAYTVATEGKLRRLAAHADQTQITFCVDTLEGAKMASTVFGEAGKTARVLIEVDCGYGRCGLPWAEAASVRVVRDIAALPNLEVVGLLTHGGQGYRGPASPEESLDDALLRAMHEERDRTLEFAERLGEAGLARPGEFEISIGSTPTMAHFEQHERAGFRITELRPGNYVFNDAIQVGLGVATLRQCALTVRASVISKHRERGRERLYIDAGKKVFTSDTGYGTAGYGIPLYSAHSMHPMPHLRIVALSEEHGWLQAGGGSTLDVGNQLRIVPNHACTTVAQQDRLYLVDGNDLVQEIAVDARDRT